MSKNLVIVESPAKAKTISGYLGDDFVVESSIGHVRDLPKSAKDIPDKYKKEKWARLGVNVEDNFQPLYVPNKGSKEQIAKLKKLMKSAEKLYLATDEDREGEAIAWHLLEVLKPPKGMDVHRMVFHEITKEAIMEAVKSPREVNMDLVNAQEARRILDRLYGFEVSPVLWRKITQRLSAGRVQSVAKKLLVDRERARMKFISAEFAELTVNLKTKPGASESGGESGEQLTATLEKLDGAKVAQSGDFDSSGDLKDQKNISLDQAAADSLKDALAGSGTEFQVSSRSSKPYSRQPKPPLTTSDLQQTAGTRLGMSSAVVMSAAQQLYQKGYITYMRTDANNLSKAALGSTRKQIEKEFGKEFLSPEVRTYKNKAKNAQEAHEAIRPTGEVFKTPQEIAKLEPAALASVYSVIYERTLASQMTNVVGETTTYKITAKFEDQELKGELKGRELLFSVGGTVITHPGFQRAGEMDAADAAEDKEDTEEKTARLPNMAESDKLEFVSADVSQKETTPPSRYSEASLVKQLEEEGVGRPSTYASTIKTVLNRGYAWKKGSQIVPAFTAFAVVQLLERHFPDLVDSKFTARLEETLDDISLGHLEYIQWLKDFYLGDNPGLQAKVEKELDSIDPRAVSTVPLGVDADNRIVEVRVGKYGPFVSRSPKQEGGDEDTASIPLDIPPDEMTIERAVEILNTPPYQELGKYEAGELEDELEGMTILALRGRYGPYVRVGTEEELKDRGIKIKEAKTSSLFESMNLDTLTLEQARELLKLPRVVGSHDDKDIVALNGPFGPYIKHGKETRQLESEEQLLSATLDECIALLAQPKKRGRGRSSSNLKELGEDPLTGKNVTLKNGRFGMYVADGEVNASLMDTDDPQELTLERASELLSARRDRLEGGD